MRLSHLVEAKPIPVKKADMPNMDLSVQNGAVISALHRAKRACKSILLTQPVLYRGSQSFSDYADHIYYLPNEFAIYEFSGRSTPRNSATGNNLVQSLTLQHPEWKKAGFPARDLSVFCANKAEDADDFGQVGIVLPFDRVMKFAVTSDDLNLKVVHKNESGDHHLLKMQNAVSAFIRALKSFLDEEVEPVVDNWQHGNLDAWKNYTGDSGMSDVRYAKKISTIPLVQSVRKHAGWLEEARRSFGRQWTVDDLKIIDELNEAWKKSRSEAFVDRVLPQFYTDKMESVFENDKVSEVFLHALRPKTLGADVYSYEDMLNEIRTTSLKEIWFEGPYYVIANHGDEDMSGERFKRFLEQDKTMQHILTEVAG